MSINSNQDTQGLAQHFTDVASDYHIDPIFQSPSSPYSQWIRKLTYDVLDLKRDHILVDAGCGTGIDCIWLLNKMNKEINVIGNDISPGMIKIFDDEIKKENLTNFIKTFCLNAVSFSQQKQIPAYHRLLLKYFVHLMSHNERLLAFKGFYQQLNSVDNKLVIMGRSSNPIFPLDRRTQEIYKSMTPSFDTYVKELETCGFINIHYDTYQYTFDNNITLDNWIDIIQKRLWSIFSRDKMNDEQLADCISYLNDLYKNQKFQLKDEIIVLYCTADKQRHSDSLLTSNSSANE
jgi:SAM-dependent methyltransferase